VQRSADPAPSPSLLGVAQHVACSSNEPKRADVGLVWRRSAARSIPALYGHRSSLQRSQWILTWMGRKVAGHDAQFRGQFPGMRTKGHQRHRRSRLEARNRGQRSRVPHPCVAVRLPLQYRRRLSEPNALNVRHAHSNIRLRPVTELTTGDRQAGNVADMATGWSRRLGKGRVS
jgi:hypothetical protein